MVTEIDHQKIKERIRDIIKAAPLAFDETGASGKFTECFVGRPYNDEISVHVTPYVFITNDDLIEEMSPSATVDSDAVQATEHIIRYILVMVQQAQDGRQVEKDLDNLGKVLIQTLKANFQLKDPTAKDDPKCDWSFPEQLRAFDTQSHGKPIQGRTLTLRLITHTS